MMVPLDLVVNLDLAALTVLGPGPSEGLARAWRPGWPRRAWWPPGAPLVGEEGEQEAYSSSSSDTHLGPRAEDLRTLRVCSNQLVCFCDKIGFVFT